ncbi:MAG: hypothetical protein GYA51_02340, partial [Candidatus Methanofastidiosa archaeon]|nr:hypothetical protein [Candidatus Methanofastidiosa archaeon]
AYGIATDSYNNVIVAGSSNFDYYTIKYDSSGNQIWAKTYDRDTTDKLAGVATDSQNNVIVTGYVYNGSNNDYYTIKYQGVPPKSKSLPIAQILKILGLYPKE